MTILLYFDLQSYLAIVKHMQLVLTVTLDS